MYDDPGVDLEVDTMDAKGNILSRSPEDLPRKAMPRAYEPSRSLGVLSTDDVE